MMPEPTFDVATAHKYFAARCFNQAWDLIEKPDRTTEDDCLMVALSQASIYHWLNRPDCDDQRLSIGYWQASRIHSLLNHPAEARRYAELCLSCSSQLEPFYLGYAHEALARAALIDGDGKAAAHHIAQAETLARAVADPQDREALANDLASLQSQ